MITYNVYYKTKFFWKKIKKVKGDYIAQENSMVRMIIQEDETVWLLPCIWLIKFSKERFYSTKERMETESGQDMKMNKR
jgi:hypothetical protein